MSNQDPLSKLLAAKDKELATEEVEIVEEEEASLAEIAMSKAAALDHVSKIVSSITSLEWYTPKAAYPGHRARIYVEGTTPYKGKMFDNRILLAICLENLKQMGISPSFQVATTLPGAPEPRNHTAVLRLTKNNEPVLSFVERSEMRIGEISTSAYNELKESSALIGTLPRR